MARTLAQGQPPALTAELTADPQRHCSGYHIHPAVLDATLHLAAAAASAAGSGDAAAPTRVPVGAAALAGASIGAGEGALFPVALPRAPALDGSTACDYCLAGQSSATANIQGLITRALPAAVPRQAAAGQGHALPHRRGEAAPAAGSNAAERALQEASAPRNLLYEPQWQATAPLQLHMPPHAAAVRFNLAGSWRPRQGRLGSGGSSRPLPAKASLEIRFRAGFRAPALPVGVVLARALEVWQRTAPTLSGGSARLLTGGALHGAGPQLPQARGSAAASGALWALLRVAASENPGVRVLGGNLSALAADGRNPGVAPSASARDMVAPEAADAFGSSAADGVQSVARLLRSALTVSPPDCHVMPCPRGALADLRMVPRPRAEPGPGEVKVRCKPSYGAGACSECHYYHLGSRRWNHFFIVMLAA